MMVQRYLSARSQRQAAGALIASGFVILAQFALFLLIGAGLYVFYRALPPPGLPGEGPRSSPRSSSTTCRPASSAW